MRELSHPFWLICTAYRFCFGFCSDFDSGFDSGFDFDSDSGSGFCFDFGCSFFHLQVLLRYYACQFLKNYTDINLFYLTRSICFAII